MSNIGIDTAKKLEQTGVKKYWRHTGQAMIVLN